MVAVVPWAAMVASTESRSGSEAVTMLAPSWKHLSRVWGDPLAVQLSTATKIRLSATRAARTSGRPLKDEGKSLSSSLYTS
jgi:hypothetical protein